MPPNLHPSERCQLMWGDTVDPQQIAVRLLHGISALLLHSRNPAPEARNRPLLLLDATGQVELLRWDGQAMSGDLQLCELARQFGSQTGASQINKP